MSLLDAIKVAQSAEELVTLFTLFSSDETFKNEWIECCKEKANATVYHPQLS
jgi:hypothetical protein